MNEVINGDCLEVMKGMDENSIDLTVTSPPYDNLRDYNGYSFKFKEIARELFRVTKHGGVVVWVVSDSTTKGSETGTSFKQALYFKDIGFNLHDTMIWVKEQLAFPTFNRYYNAFEYMFVFSKGKPKSFNALKDRVNRSAGRSVSGKARRTDGGLDKRSGEGGEIKEKGVRWNYWLVPNQQRGIKHPAPFPEKLAHDHILSWSNAGDTVLDPMCGSGTTLKMAKQLKRKFIGIEISREYCEIAEKRIAATQPDAQQKLF